MNPTNSIQPTGDDAQNRRRYSRYAGDPHDILVDTGSRTVKCKLINESIGGLAMLTADVKGLSVGQFVDLNVRDDTTTGYVRSVDVERDGTYRISVSWEKRPFREANTIVAYMVCDDMLLACQILSDSSGPIRRVRLWDGAEFEVVSDTVCTRSYEERRDELNTTPTILPTLAQLYGLKPEGDTSEMIANILDFEFSSRFNAAGRGI